MHHDRRVALLPLAAVPAALALVTMSACIPDVTPDPLTLPRCSTMDGGCGSAGTDDCCASDTLPGATYNPLDDTGLTATVNTFKLDRYEVTVGRLRAFVEGYSFNKPAAGAGADPSLGAVSGWDPDWTSLLPSDQAALLTQLNCDPTFQTWTDTALTSEDLPANCVTWYVAFAFCAWDGGWLPTEAEWDFASTGGAMQLQYPWGPAAPDPTLAVYGCDTSTTVCPLPRVGSKPLGKGFFGTLDLAGSIAEWNLDYYTDPPTLTGCGDTCAVLTDMGQGRVVHGGDFSHDQSQLPSSFRIAHTESDVETILGFRCARPVPP
jgi:formylglycine-generating enzyme